MKNIALSLLLLSASIGIHAAEDTITHMIEQDSYMVELYQNITEFCKNPIKKIYDAKGNCIGEKKISPSSILLVVPLELIMVSGELPQEMKEKIALLTKSMSEEGGQIDNDAAMDLVVELIPHMRLIDERIAASIAEMQKLGVRIIALSPFMPQHADAMLARMKKCGLNFASTALYKKDMPIDDEFGNRVALSKNGVVFMNDYFQSMAVLQTMVNNAAGEIEQPIFAAPMPAQAQDDSN